jgi:hypothetical protein
MKIKYTLFPNKLLSLLINNFIYTNSFPKDYKIKILEDSIYVVELSIKELQFEIRNTGKILSKIFLVRRLKSLNKCRNMLYQIYKTIKK